MGTTAGKYINMRVVVAMVRGINVGGHKKIGMADLKALGERIGLTDVQTYIQSGNLIFTTTERDLAALSRRLEAGIESRFGFAAEVIIRTAEEMRSAAARNPFRQRKGIEPKRLLVGFLAREPNSQARNNLLSIEAAPEEVRIDGRELYVYYPDGMARPKLSWATIEKTLETSGTGRNWNTVLTLVAMCERGSERS